MASQGPERDGNYAPETQPLLVPRPSIASHHSGVSATKQLTARHAFAVLVTLQIGSGIFASRSQVDSNVPSPGAALLVWVLGGLLSWAGAASFAELGAAIPLNGGMQAYLAYVYEHIAESVGPISSRPTAAWVLKLVAALIFVAIVLVNSINTNVTIRLSESSTGIKLMTVFLVVVAGLVAVIAHLVNPNSSLSGGEDWHSRNWFTTRPTFYEGHTIDWSSMNTWDRYGHYSAAIYGGLWTFYGWDNANVVASEIRNPGQALPKAIKAAMISCWALTSS
ncbi:amino acid transporter [Paraphaeosphaeria minitans]|uniref:Amino acid transporter n=1 Tax=Paraphaeosphaeria minitans TaxID=565426 RepID=A0A9P6KWV0_9PLEO|nr:amino acid transporter [Paraphaeosphaeria minitans]